MSRHRYILLCIIHHQYYLVSNDSFIALFFLLNVKFSDIVNLFCICCHSFIQRQLWKGTFEGEKKESKSRQ